MENSGQVVRLLAAACALLACTPVYAARQCEGSNPVHFESSQLGFVYVTIRGSRLTAEFVGVTGATLFTRAITKGSTP